MTILRYSAVSIIAAFTLLGCGQSDDTSRRPCTGAKCDIPDGEAGEQCTARRRDAFNDNQLAFTESALRWSCQDVSGVWGLDRGQEYCEYFGVVQLPPLADGGEQPEPAVLGRLIRVLPDHPEQEVDFDQTEVGVTLSSYQVEVLEEDPSAVVGQCVFTSWNLDAEEDVPACDGKDGCPQVMGLDVDAENFRMKFDFNSADAAQVLIDDCLFTEKEGDQNNPSDPLHDDFIRGCMLNADLNETQYRKSDSTLCSAVNRLAECECYPNDFDSEFTDALSPLARRGFPLGTWSGAAELPAGCSYVGLGDGSNTVVQCELTAADVLGSASDPKALCRERYAANVVVHVPIDRNAITCDPNFSESPYADSCGETPWVLRDGSPNQQY